MPASPTHAPASAVEPSRVRIRDCIYGTERAISVILPSRGEAAINVSIGVRWEAFVERVVSEGRYQSASEVVREGLRLVEEREAKLLALRATLEASIAQGGEVTDEDLEADLAARSAELRSKGYGA